MSGRASLVSAVGACLMMGACMCSQQGEATPKEEPVATPGATTVISFAGSFRGQGGCNKIKRGACDIYLAELDLDSGTLLTIRPLIEDSRVTQDFPVFDPTGQHILMQEIPRQPPQIRYLSLSGRDRVLLEEASHPYLSPDGKILAYEISQHRVGRDVVFRSIDLESDPPQLGEVTQISQGGGTSEPFIFPDNRHIGFYRKGSQPKTGQTRIHDMETGESTGFSLENGCAHGGVDYSGSRAFCQKGHTIYSRTFVDGEWGELEKSRYPQANDPDLEECDRVTYGHSEFCGDDDHLLTTYSCMKNREMLWARLMIHTWDGEITALLTRQASEMLGVATGQSRSGRCTPVQ